MKTWLTKLLQPRPREARSPFTSAEILPYYKRRSDALFYCDFFALLVASERGSDTLEPRDALAGIYIASAEFQNLLRYWTDWGGLERLVRSECGTLNPRLFYWFWWANRRGKSVGKGFFKKVSPELEKVSILACDFASRRYHGSKNIPIVTPEDVLLAMVRLQDIPIGKKLLDSGLDLAHLERQVQRVEP